MKDITGNERFTLVILIILTVTRETYVGKYIDS